MKEEGGRKKALSNEDLLQRTKDFALRIIRLSSSLPSNRETDILARQVLRAGTSPGANYREAHRARSRAEFAAKIGECLKEQHETQYWLELLAESGLIPSARLTPLQNECGELIAIFSTIRKKAKRPLPTSHFQLPPFP